MWCEFCQKKVEPIVHHTGPYIEKICPKCECIIDYKHDGSVSIDELGEE